MAAAKIETSRRSSDHRKIMKAIIENKAKPKIMANINEEKMHIENQRQQWRIKI